MAILDCKSDITSASCCIVLNSEQKQEQQHSTVLGGAFFISKWNSSPRRICTDGGYHFIHSRKDLLPPTLIIGDLDSLSSAAFNAATAADVDKEIQIIQNPCQNTTDFEKSIKYVLENFNDGAGCGGDNNCSDGSDGKVGPILVFGGLGGRFDHVCACIDVLVRYSSIKIWLIDQSSIAVICPVGDSRIICHNDFDNDFDNGINTINANAIVPTSPCGLIPITGASQVKTKGLKWDIDGRLEFGSLISTSNVALEQSVIIKTDKPLLWTFRNNLL